MRPPARSVAARVAPRACTAMSIMTGCSTKLREPALAAEGSRTSARAAPEAATASLLMPRNAGPCCCPAARSRSYNSSVLIWAATSFASTVGPTDWLPVSRATVALACLIHPDDALRVRISIWHVCSLPVSVVTSTVPSVTCSIWCRLSSRIIHGRSAESDANASLAAASATSA